MQISLLAAGRSHSLPPDLPSLGGVFVAPAPFFAVEESPHGRQISHVVVAIGQPSFRARRQCLGDLPARLNLLKYRISYQKKKADISDDCFS
jgi:hypothetical protein